LSEYPNHTIPLIGKTINPFHKIKFPSHVMNPSNNVPTLISPPDLPTTINHLDYLDCSHCYAYILQWSWSHMCRITTCKIAPTTIGSDCKLAFITPLIVASLYIIAICEWCNDIESCLVEYLTSYDVPE
jgi:hypothetical protein